MHSFGVKHGHASAARASKTSGIALNSLWWPIAFTRAIVHCLIKHGAGPLQTEHRHRLVLICPACGRIFWRDRY
jgi:hypothetical protein